MTPPGTSQVPAIDLDGLRASGRLSGEGTIEAWLTALAKVRPVVDARATAARRARVLRQVAIVVLILAVAIAVFAYAPFWVAVPLVVVVAALARRHGRMLPASSGVAKVRALRGLLEGLRAEIEPGTPVRLEADLSTSLVKAKRRAIELVLTGLVGARRVRVATQRFVDPWLTLRIAPGAGVLIALTAEDRVTWQTRRFKTARSRFKTKQRIKVDHRVRARVAAAADGWVLAPSGAAHDAVVSRPTGSGDRWLRVRIARRATSTPDTLAAATPTAPPALLLDSLGAACAALRPRAGPRGRAGT